jgi:uncharacterized RDD family membrane protein YckC
MSIKTDSKLQRRAVALIIDYTIFFVYFFWFGYTYGTPNDEGGFSINGWRGLWIEVGWFIYFPVVESLKGQTLGKMMLGLKVVTKNGNPISFVQAIKRHLVDIFDFSFFGLIAFITVKNTPDHQRLGDLWAKTIVIGGDAYTCSHCHEQLTLTHDEITRGKFTCPKCKSENENI